MTLKSPPTPVIEKKRRYGYDKLKLIDPEAISDRSSCIILTMTTFFFVFMIEHSNVCDALPGVALSIFATIDQQDLATVDIGGD